MSQRILNLNHRSPPGMRGGLGSAMRSVALSATSPLSAGGRRPCHSFVEKRTLGSPLWSSSSGNRQARWGLDHPSSTGAQPPPRGPQQTGCTRPGVQASAAATELETEQKIEHASVESAEAETSLGPVAWTKAWYPVAALDGLDAKRPMNVKLLGKDLVVWGDSSGTAWHCLEDKCAHRMAPLSEGRVEGDNIMCVYHGWHFDGEGKCTQIPQIDDPKAHEQSCSQARSHVKAYPTKVEHGLLWVWPEHGLDALLESSAAPLRINYPENPEDGTWTRPYTWFVRDLPLRFDTAVENLIDISHAPHAHHGVPGMGDRNKPMRFLFSRNTPIERDGFCLDLKMLNSPFSFKVSFSPPAFIRHAGTVFSNEMIVVPTEAGWSRVFMTSLILDSKTSRKLPLPVVMLGALKAAFPALDHVMLKHAIFDGDTFMLHKAERELLKVDNKWRENFFMPAQDDLPIVTFRRWLQDHGGDVPTCGPLSEMPPAMTKAEALNRHHQHTRNCSHCQQAVKTIDVLRAVSLVGAALSVMVVLSKAIAGQPILQAGMLAAMAAALVCSGLAYSLDKLRDNFFYMDYVHAHKD